MNDFVLSISKNVDPTKELLGYTRTALRAIKEVNAMQADDTLQTHDINHRLVLINAFPPIVLRASYTSIANCENPCIVVA